MPLNANQKRFIQKYPRKAMPKAKVSKPVKAYVKKTITDTKETNYVDQKLGAGTTLRASFDVPYAINLTEVVQGDTIDQRDGNRIEPTKLSIMMKLNHVSAVYQTRIMLIQWRPDNQVDAPSLLKIFGTASTADIMAYQLTPNKSERLKYSVLYDRLINDTVGGQLQHFPKINISKFANKYVNFNGVGQLYGKSMIYLFVFSNAGNSDGNRPSFFLNTRLTFKE